MLKVGVVLGGGFAKVGFQIGFLQNIKNELKPENIAAISCASAGIFSGYAYMTNKLNGLERILTTCKFKSILGFTKAVWKNKLLQRVAEDLIDEKDEINIDSYVSACCVPKLGACYFNLKEYDAEEKARLFQAGVAFPVLCPGPISFEKKLYIDGGFLDNIPVYPLFGEDLDVLFIFHTDPSYVPRDIVYQQAKVVIDIDTSAYTDKRASSFTVSPAALKAKVAVGKAYGTIFAEKVLKDFDTLTVDELRERALEFNKEDYVRRVKKSALRLESMATFINEIYWDLIF